MEKPRPSANDKPAMSARRPGKAGTGIEVLQRVVERCGRPGFSLPAQTVIDRQTVRDPPFVLKVEALVGVVQGPFGLIPNRGRYARSLVDRRIERSLVETGGRVEALEKNHKGMRSAHEVVAQEGIQVREVGLKGIEQGKRLSRAHSIEISTKAEV